jgi:hypothetical protein
MRPQTQFSYLTANPFAKGSRRFLWFVTPQPALLGQAFHRGFSDEIFTPLPAGKIIKFNWKHLPIPPSGFNSSVPEKFLAVINQMFGFLIQKKDHLTGGPLLHLSLRFYNKCCIQA